MALFAAAQLGDAERCRQLLAIKADPARREQVTGFSDAWRLGEASMTSIFFGDQWISTMN